MNHSVSSRAQETRPHNRATDLKKRLPFGEGMTSKDNTQRKSPGRSYDPDIEETIDEFLARQTGNGETLRDAISFLIHRRELLRDSEIEMLEAQSQALAQKLAEKRNRILIEELDCFREILRLHKRLVTENGQHGN